MAVQSSNNVVFPGIIYGFPTNLWATMFEGWILSGEAMPRLDLEKKNISDGSIMALAADCEAWWRSHYATGDDIIAALSLLQGNERFLSILLAESLIRVCKLEANTSSAKYNLSSNSIIARFGKSI